jgi:hypothetical protein
LCKTHKYKLIYVADTFQLQTVGPTVVRTTCCLYLFKISLFVIQLAQRVNFVVNPLNERAACSGHHIWSLSFMAFYFRSFSGPQCSELQNITKNGLLLYLSIFSLSFTSHLFLFPPFSSSYPCSLTISFSLPFTSSSPLAPSFLLFSFRCI